MINKRFFILLVVGLSAKATWQDKFARVKDAIAASREIAKQAVSVAQDFVTGGDALTQAYLEAAGTQSEKEARLIQRFVERQKAAAVQSEDGALAHKDDLDVVTPSSESQEEAESEVEGALLKDTLANRNEESAVAPVGEGNDYREVEVESEKETTQVDVHNLVTSRGPEVSEESDYTPMFADRAQSEARGYEADCDSICAQRGDSDPKGPGLRDSHEEYVHNKPEQDLLNSPQTSAFQKFDGTKAFYDKEPVVGTPDVHPQHALNRHVQHSAILPGEIMAAKKKPERMKQVKTLVRGHTCLVSVPERLIGDQKALERYIKENFDRKGVEIC